MIEKEVQELLSFIDGNPTAYHTAASVRNILLNAGFSELLESRRWQLEPGRSYFVCRNGSSILAFRMGEQLENHMVQNYTKLNTEGYGGMICSTWMDRPLSVAGRVLIKENDAITSRLLTLDRDLLMIPSVAIHMDREVNDRASYNKQVDMLPLLGGAAEEGVLKKLIAAELRTTSQRVNLFEKVKIPQCRENIRVIKIAIGDEQTAALGLLENIQRADLNPFEQAQGMKDVMVLWDCTQAEAAKRLGMAQPTLANKLRLLQLNADQRQFVLDNNLTERHARAVLRLPENRRSEALINIAKRRMNARQTDLYIEQLLNTPAKGRHRVSMVKDVRIFVNTIDHAIRLMTDNGVPATAHREEKDGYIEYTVRIPTAAAER